MSSEIVKYDYGPSKLKPLSAVMFVLIFLVGGFCINFVVQMIISGVGVFCAMFTAAGFFFLKAMGLTWLSWILVIPFICVWFPLNYFFQKWFIQAFSGLAGMRRFQSAIILTLSTLPFLVFYLWIGFSGHKSIIAGDAVSFGSIVGFLAQILECARIYKLRSLPLSHFAVLPKSGKKKEALERQLVALENARNQPEFEKLTMKALDDMHLGELKLRTTTEAPIAILLEALVKHKKMDKADAISQTYLRVVDK